MWTLDPEAALPLWRWRLASPDPILAFTTRRGGVSEVPYDTLNLGRSTRDRLEAVDENRRRVLAVLGCDPERLATAGQVHGVAWARVEAPGLHPNVDALITTTPGIPIAVTAADCLPLLMIAPGAVAAVHSGWRGTAAEAPRLAVQALCETAGAAPERISVHLGPCIRSCCYHVGPEVADRFPEDALIRTRESIRLDLARASLRQLVAAGVPEASIHDTRACTACDPTWYFSHRRDGSATGRQWAIAALRDETPRRTNGRPV